MQDTRDGDAVLAMLNAAQAQGATTPLGTGLGLQVQALLADPVTGAVADVYGRNLPSGSEAEGLAVLTSQVKGPRSLRDGRWPP